MKKILSEVLRRRNGVERRKGRAGALRIEFIERSRDESLGIEWVFAAFSTLETRHPPSIARFHADRVEWSTGAEGLRTGFRQLPERLQTELR
jgi:hypothetical protein